MNSELNREIKMSEYGIYPQLRNFLFIHEINIHEINPAK